MRESTREITAHVTRSEGDRIARMVLQLVEAIVRGSKEIPDHIPLVPGPEPTSTGYLEPSVRDIVMKRSA